MQRGQGSRLLVMSLAALALFASPQARGKGTRWPNGARAAIVLTYDDALASQLDRVVPTLRRARLNATFFLANVQEADVERWRSVARDGNELANHTIFHPCLATTYPADPRDTSEAYTPASLLREIAAQNTLLRALDGQARHGFATPCGQTVAGGQDYLEPLRRSGLVTYVRGVTLGADDLAADVATIDPMRVPAQGFGEGTTLAQLIALAERAREGGGWAVYLFHGVGADQLAISPEIHAAFIDWLSAHRSGLWVTTLQRALDWAKAHPHGRAGRDPVPRR